MQLFEFSKNHRFSFFKCLRVGEPSGCDSLKTFRIKELVGLHYFKNLKELAVFTKEPVKNGRFQVFENHGYIAESGV